MAGSADIKGTQYYTMGIGHPNTNTSTEGTPVANAKTIGLYGDKIRSAIQSAVGRNSLEVAPHAPAPTYAANTVYGAGAVVRGTLTDADNLYTMMGNPTNTGKRGTSGAASPPTGTGNGLITDNTCVWLYIGKTWNTGSFPLYSTVTPAAETDVMDGFVAFVANTSLTTLGLTRQYTNNRTGAGPFARMGNYIRFNPAQTYIDPQSSWNGTLSGGSLQGTRAFMEFTTSAQQWIGLQELAIIIGSYGTEPNGIIESYEITVNGINLSESPLMFNTPSGATTILLDLRKFGNGEKTIRISSPGSWGFRCPNKVFVKDTEAVWATSPANNFKISVEGDSIGQGSYNSAQATRSLLEYRLMDLLGFSDCINTSIGGTSATNISNSGKTAATQDLPSTVNTTFGERIRFIQQSGIPDIHVISGFHNEVSNISTANREARRNAIFKYFTDCRLAFPDALIVVLPTLPLSGDTLTTGGGSSLLDLEDDVIALFNKWGDEQSLYIPLQRQNFPFYTGSSIPVTSWYNSGAGSDPYSDSHPVSRFYTVIADYVANAIRKWYLTR
jgi:hypothetical protein